MDEGRAEPADVYGELDIELIDSLWNLAEDFSVDDAAALIAGYNPVIVQRCRTDTSFDANFPRYPVALKAITHAITNQRLKASLRYQAREYGYADMMADMEYSDALYVTASGTTAEEDELLSQDHTCFYKPFPDWSLSTIPRDELVRWLRSRGIRTGFFFPSATKNPDYLDPSHPRYAPKLAAAVNAWLALDDESSIRAKSPKQALTRWLRENAARFRLSDDDGKPNETGIEECAKVANWQEKGGAPKTPA